VASGEINREDFDITWNHALTVAPDRSPHIPRLRDVDRGWNQIHATA
jgi:hypothetical protein